MKKRIIKKWINRYIAPLVEDLPAINNFDRDEFINITLINGEDVPEGNMYITERNHRTAIKKQVQALQRILKDNDGKEMFIRRKPEAIIRDNQKWEDHPDNHRKNPRMKFSGIGMRLFIRK